MNVYVDVCVDVYHHVYIDVYVNFMLCVLCLHANLDVYHLVLSMRTSCSMCMCMRMFMLYV